MIMGALENIDLILKMVVQLNVIVCIFCLFFLLGEIYGDPNTGDYGDVVLINTLLTSPRTNQ